MKSLIKGYGREKRLGYTALNDKMFLYSQGKTQLCPKSNLR
jgi:hypothetical protein